MAGFGSLLIPDFRSPLANRKDRGWSAPLFPIFPGRQRFASGAIDPSATGNLPAHMLDHTRLGPRLNSYLTRIRLGNAFPQSMLHKGHDFQRRVEILRPLDCIGCGFRVLGRVSAVHR